MLSSNIVDNLLTQVIQEKFAAIEPLLNERTRRRWVAVEARALGRGGIARVAEATGLSRATIGAGLRELAEGPADDDGRLRSPGAGRKALAVHDAGLVAALETLVDGPHDHAERLGDPFRVGREQLPHGTAGDGGTDGKSSLKRDKFHGDWDYSLTSREIKN